jgi:Mn2+/Fe2+ NRAMP family transporter
VIGRVTGCGLARNLGDILPRPTVLGLVGLLFLANTIDIGANLAAMGAAAQLSTDLPALPFTIGFAVVSVALPMFISYTTYARYLTGSRLFCLPTWRCFSSPRSTGSLRPKDI